MTWHMKPDEAASGPSPVWSTHGASSPCVRSDGNVAPSQSRAFASTLPLNSTRPRRPSLRYAFAASEKPAPDHSSVREDAEREVGVRP